MNAGAKEQKYSKIRRRINILGFTVFIGVAAASILTTTQVFNAAWTEWWVGVGGLLVGFAVALGVCVMMDYVVGRDYELIRLSLWEYVLLRFRFLFILFLVPVAIAVVIGAIVTTYYSEPLVWYVLLFRTLAFAVLIVFAGFVLPYLFGKISGAESVEQETRSLAYDIAEKMGVTIQGVYRVPLEGLRRANAVQVGFLEEKKVVYLLGGWKKYFKKNEIKAVLAHEFAHAKYDHIRKLLVAQLFCRVGIPGLIFLSIDFAMKALQIPKPAPIAVAIAFLSPALVLLIGSVLFPAWLSRKYETQADSQAAEVIGADAMISALRELAELNLIPKERSHPLSTHPSIKERIRALKSSHAR